MFPASGRPQRARPRQRELPSELRQSALLGLLKGQVRRIAEAEAFQLARRHLGREELAGAELRG